jgi:chromosome segregation ATPase
MLVGRTLMGKKDRGSVLLKLLGLLLVVGGFAGLAAFVDYRVGDVSEEIASLERRLLVGETERRQLRSELARTLDLYEMVGSELAAKDEEFSTALGRAVVAKDEEIARTREVLDEVRQSVDRLAPALDEENRRRVAELARVEQAVRESRASIGAMEVSFEGLAGRIDTVGRELRAEIGRLDKALGEYRKALDDRDEAREEKVASLDGRMATELGWMQGELQRVRRQVDDLNHAVGRLEARRPE